MRTTLRSFGWLWRFRPGSLSTPECRRLRAASSETEVFDLFISHTWMTPGYYKYLSLLLSSYLHFAFMAWVAVAISVLLLYEVNMLPMPFVYQAVATQLEVPCGIWGGCLTFLFALGALFVAPDAASACGCQSQRCFYDLVSIDQEDASSRERGIASIGGFLARSTQLRILWSRPYLSRLWCVFELAAYRRANPLGKVRFQALFIERDFLVLWICCFVLTSVSYICLVSPSIELPPGWFLVLTPLWLAPAVHVARHGFLDQEQMLRSLEDFDLNAATCTKEIDREFIHAAISRWYGSLPHFVDYVQKVLAKELKKNVSQNRVPLKYCLMAASPVMGFHLDVIGALLAADVRADVVARLFAQFVSVDVVGIWLIKFFFWLARRFARPRFTWRALDWMQSALVSLLGCCGISVQVAVVRLNRISPACALAAAAVIAIGMTRTPCNAGANLPPFWRKPDRPRGADPCDK
ncbi:unnamed protein product [Symbiodinium natans]|uniref:Uncharacterized protein n=1 Tax=Symbiodinium natans TaxID=878477 RepID=A0A812SYK4_9DINO|nr:unnamed protein product [Symbiodinium natans]